VYQLGVLWLVDLVDQLDTICCTSHTSEHRGSYVFMVFVKPKMVRLLAREDDKVYVRSQY
jgi:hypothetical protein